MLNERKVVPVVFSANNAYTLFCYIAIYSMIVHADSRNLYEVYVFVTGMEDDNKALIESLTNEFVHVQCVDISNFTENIELKESIHLSIETYYRLFIPVVLPQYDKILYLDSDMCILADVAELYRMEIDGYPVGAISDVKSYYLDIHSREIGDLDFRKTFNAGVLLINTVEFEKQEIRKKCLTLLAEDYKREVRRFIYADQDALNVVLYKNYRLLNDKWNYQPQYLWRIEEVVEDERQKYIEEEEKALIMHFAGDKKPWRYPELPKSKIFWDYAKETPIFERLLSTIIGDILKSTERCSCFEVYQFPYDKVPFKSKIVLYAAGMVGKSFYYQLEASKYAEVVLWVDRDWQKADKTLNVCAIDIIKQVEFDYVIVAIDNERIATSIQENLQGMKIPKDKIVWSNYKNNKNS